jgi:hypothetical protein
MKNGVSYSKHILLAASARAYAVLIVVGLTDDIFTAES